MEHNDKMFISHVTQVTSVQDSCNKKWDADTVQTYVPHTSRML